MSPKREKGGHVTNVGASVRARLLNIARKSDQDYNRVLVQYAQERMLYRFSISRYRDNFILKGALLFLTYNMPDVRPTKDIDFLGDGVPNDVDGIKSVIEEVAAVAVEDGVTFDSSTIAAKPIAEQAEYGGLRVFLRCSIGGARIVLQKDFYDLVHLALHQTIGAEVLAKALVLTFSTRGTPLADRRLIFADSFKTDTAKETQWIAFHTTNRLRADRSFREAIDLIEQFIEPILVDSRLFSHWQPEQFHWQMREATTN